MNAADSLRMFHLNDHLFSKIASKMGLTLLSWHPVDMSDGMSFIYQIVRPNDQDRINAGNLAFDIHLLADGEDGRQAITKRVILRIKTPGKIAISTMVKAISKSSLQEAEEATIALQYLNKSEIRDVLLAKAVNDKRSHSLCELNSSVRGQHSSDLLQDEGSDYFERV